MQTPPVPQMRVNKNLSLSPVLEQLVSSVNSEEACFGEFSLFMEFRETDRIPTAGVYITFSGMKCDYNPEFMGKLTLKEQKFIILHEIWHLWRCHFERAHGTDPTTRHLRNIAADMLINDSIKYDWTDEPENLCKLPKEYTGDQITEHLADWLREKMEEEAMNMSTLDEHSDGTGENGEDGVPDSFARSMVDDILTGMRARGTMPANLDQRIGQLRKHPIDYLKLIKSSLGLIKGRCTKRTFRRMHRRGFEGIKGRLHQGAPVRIILDTSGSMFGLFEKVLSVLYRGGYTLMIYQIDTELKSEPTIINSQKQLLDFKIAGGGGTILQPAINHLAGERVLILTDGYTDTLDCSGLKQCLIITAGVECPISGGSPRQIVIEKDK